MDNIIDKKSFSQLVEDFIHDRPMPYIDAIVMCADKHGMEVEMAARLVNKNIRDKVEYEAQSLNLVKSSAKLPI